MEKGIKKTDKASQINKDNRCTIPNYKHTPPPPPPKKKNEGTV